MADRKLSTLGLLPLALAVGTGCSAISHDVEEFPGGACHRGETQPCFCLPGEPGFQQCLPDASGWEDCVCPDGGEGEGEGESRHCTGQTIEDAAGAERMEEERCAGRGACPAGRVECVRGRLVCSTFPGGSDDSSSPERCNGADDDCDGAVDEGEDDGPLERTCYTGTTGTNGVGRCRGGAERCVEGAWSGACEGEAVPEAWDHTCNGADDDCDGDIDEGLEPEGWVCLRPSGPEGFVMGSPGPECPDGDCIDPRCADGACPQPELGHMERETQHRVVLTRAFLMKATEVTENEWQQVALAEG